MKENKIQEFIKAAKEISTETGFDFFILLTQAWHETGGFSKIIGKNNFWGLKTPKLSAWNGLRIEVYTSEKKPLKTQEETPEQALERFSLMFGLPKSKLSVQRVKIGNGDFWNISLPQEFRDYETVDESIRDFVSHIQKNFPKAYEARSNYQEYFKRVKNKNFEFGKLQYATDPEYAKKCEDLYIYIKTKLK